MWPLLAFAGGGLGAAGKLFEGFAKSDAAKIAAQADRDNADLLSKQADITKSGADLSLTQGAWNASQVARQVRSSLGGLASYFGGRNIDASSGSPLLMAGFSAAQGATDMALAAAKGEIGYADQRTEASSIYGQAASQQWAAVQQEQNAITARISGIFGAATSLLSMGATPWAGLSSAFSGASPVNVGSATTFVAGDPWEGMR